MSLWRGHSHKARPMASLALWFWLAGEATRESLFFSLYLFFFDFRLPAFTAEVPGREKSLPLGWEMSVERSLN